MKQRIVTLTILAIALLGVGAQFSQAASKQTIITVASTSDSEKETIG